VTPERLDAWLLPPDAHPAERTEAFMVGGLEVRFPAEDPAWVGALADRLVAAAHELRSLPLDDVLAALGTVGERLLDPGSRLRARALELLPSESGLSPEMSAAVLDGMARDWTEERLRALVEAELPRPEALDGFVDESVRRVRAMGPALAFQVVAGSVPGVGATALLRSLLTKGPTLLKPGSGDLTLPLLVAETVAEAHPALARAVAVVYWPGGREALEDAVLQRADVVVAYGGDASVGALSRRTPVTRRFVGYHHRVSVGVVGRSALEPDRMERTASEVAGSIALFDQRGCVSPRLVWVEETEGGEARVFARRLAAALQALETHLPGGRLDPAEGSALHQLRGTAELLAGDGRTGPEVHHGGGASWTVVFDPDPAFDPGCVGRVVRVKPVEDLREVVDALRPVGPHLQTVGLAGAGERAMELAEALARIGVSRVAGFEDVPFPPPWWHHDGRGGLEALLRWVDLETDR
jgi:hypothetical protein